MDPYKLAERSVATMYIKNNLIELGKFLGYKDIDKVADAYVKNMIETKTDDENYKEKMRNVLNAILQGIGLNKDYIEMFIDGCMKELDNRIAHTKEMTNNESASLEDLCMDALTEGKLPPWLLNKKKGDKDDEKEDKKDNKNKRCFGKKCSKGKKCCKESVEESVERPHEERLEEAAKQGYSINK